MKKASDVAFLLKTMYDSKANPLTWPEVFQCDNGSEFKSDVTKLLESQNVKINSVVRQSISIHIQHLSRTLTSELAEKLFHDYGYERAPNWRRQ